MEQRISGIDGKVEKIESLVKKSKSMVNTKTTKESKAPMHKMSRKSETLKKDIINKNRTRRR